MGGVPAHFIRRGSKWTYRRRVPEDVRHDPAFGGREHFHRSLKTSDLNEAKRKALTLSLWFDAEVNRVRGVPVGEEHARDAPRPGYVLTDLDLSGIQARWWRDAVQLDYKERLAVERDPDGPLADMVAGRDDANHFELASFNDPERGVENRRRYFKKVIYPDIEPFVQAECSRRGIEQGSVDYFRVRDAIAFAELDVMRSRFERSMGEVWVEPTTPSVRKGVVGEGAPTSKGSWTLRRLMEHCLEVRAGGASWRHKVEVVVGQFEAFLERPKAVSQISRTDVLEFIELARNAPDRASMRFPGASLKQAVALNRERERPFPRISANTVRDTHFAVLRWLLSYAHGDLNAISSDPTSAIKVSGAKRRGRARIAMSEEELARMLDLPVFAGCASSGRLGSPGTFQVNDHRFWAPIIMLFSGARPSEIAQLAVSDVKVETSYPYISILTEFDPSDPEDRPFVVSYKTGNAPREMPIHRELIALGLLEYATAMRDSGSERLFPEWKLSADPRKLYSGASWVRTFNERWLPQVSNRYPKPSLYSLRHTAKTQMVHCGVSAQIQNQLLGHAQVGMDQAYLSTLSIERLAIELNKLCYPGIDVAPLRRSSLPSTGRGQ